jgi:hypothetical protein
LIEGFTRVIFEYEDYELSCCRRCFNFAQIMRLVSCTVRRGLGPGFDRSFECGEVESEGDD